VRVGAGILGISRQRLSLVRQRAAPVPLELVPLLAIAADDPAVTVASIRPDYPGFHIVAAIARSKRTAHLLGDMDLAEWDAWLMMASGKPVAFPKWVGEEPDDPAAG